VGSGGRLPTCLATGFALLLVKWWCGRKLKSKVGLTVNIFGYRNIAMRGINVDGLPLMSMGYGTGLGATDLASYGVMGRGCYVGAATRL
jgi:hypothetical protein